MAKNKVFSAKIKGLDWKFYAQSATAYTRKHGKDSHAITYTKDREVFFNANTLAPEYVRHEIFHAYICSCSINSSDLSTDQMEEVAAEIYGEHGPEMDLLTDQILNFFLR